MTYHIKYASKWARRRRAVFKRDNYICQICKKDFKDSKELLTVDHIVRAGKDSEKLYDINNLRTVCKSCHVERHRKDRPSKKRRAELRILKEERIAKRAKEWNEFKLKLGAVAIIKKSNKK